MIEWKNRGLGVNPILLEDPRSYTSPTGDLATHEHIGGNRGPRNIVGSVSFGLFQ